MPIPYGGEELLAKEIKQMVDVNRSAYVKKWPSILKSLR